MKWYWCITNHKHSKSRSCLAFLPQDIPTRRKKPNPLRNILTTARKATSRYSRTSRVFHLLFCNGFSTKFRLAYPVGTPHWLRFSWKLSSWIVAWSTIERSTSSTSSTWSWPLSSFTTTRPLTIPEPTWHHNKRKRRRQDRIFLRRVSGKRKSLRYWQAIKRLHFHHGSEVPRAHRKAVMAKRWDTYDGLWSCKHCYTRMPLTSTRCSSCRGWWETIMAPTRQTQRKRSKSQPREKTKAQQDGSSVLSPFSARLQQMEKGQKGPWQATTPQSRTNSLMPEAPKNTPGTSSTQSGPSDAVLRQRVLEVLKDGGDLTGGLRNVLAKAVEEVPAEGPKHADLNRLQNTRKSIQRLQEKKANMDREWLEFQQQMAAKFNKQKEAYLTIRAQISTAITEKAELYNQTLKTIKEKTPTTEMKAEKDPEAVIDLENSPLPWTIPILDDTEMDLTIPDSPVRKAPRTKAQELKQEGTTNGEPWRDSLNGHSR